MSGIIKILFETFSHSYLKTSLYILFYIALNNNVRLIQNISLYTFHGLLNIYRYNYIVIIFIKKTERAGQGEKENLLLFFTHGHSFIILGVG
jgi:hypothetical protein